MTLLIALLGVTFSPADSARALLHLRYISEAAVLYAQMAAVEDGVWLVEYGRLLEASGDFPQAGRIYGLALGRSTSEESTRWLMNRLRGTTLLDTTLVITVRIANRGNIPAEYIQVVLPEPFSHPPFQQLTVMASDFSSSLGMLTADIPSIAPGDSVSLTHAVRVFQQPGTMRPVPESVEDDLLFWISRTLGEMEVPETLPGPCVPMCMELARLGAVQGIELTTVGGVIVDGSECVFHAWNELVETGIRIDPLLFKSDSILATAHNPTDVIPLWNLDSTDGYELTVLFEDSSYDLDARMKAFFK